MRRLLLLAGVTATLAACGGDDGDEPVTGDITATVSHYGYTFDIDSRAARAEITARVEQGGNCLTLPFRAEGGQNATLDGAPATITVADEQLTACSERGTNAAEVVLALDVTIPLGTVQGSQVGYSKTADSQGNPFYYLVSWVGGCSRFAPCDDRPDQFATYAFTVTHPASHQVACPGTIVEDSPTQTTCRFDLPGGPTYSTFGVAAYARSVWVSSDKGTWGSARATVWANPGTLVADKIDVAHHHGFMTFMESTFGAYPYGGELRVYAAPTYWSGFEHPGSIILDNSLGRATGPYSSPVQHVLDHEIAHQWAGDETTLADTYDFVWKEAMAEYLTFVHEDTVTPGAARVSNAYWKSASLGAGYFPVPEDKPPLFDYYGDVYGPGPMILFRQVEAMSSRAQVIAGLQTLLGEPRTISVDDVVSALAASTGLDLAPYAAAWIRGRGAPTWPTARTTLLSQTQVSIELTAGQERRCAFHLALRDAGTENVAYVPVDTRTGTTQTLTFPAPAFTVTRVELDPYKECLVFPDGTAMRQRRVPTPWLSPRGLAAQAQAQAHE